MRNREWFYSLKPREMVEWLDSEHVEDELRFADECRDPGVTGWWPDERDCMAEAAEAPSDSREKLDDRWYAHGGVMQLTKENVEKLRGIVMPYHNGEKQAKLMGKEYEFAITDELHDSREKLEADVLDHQGAWPLTDSTPIDVTWGIVRGWLDRQAAITERECDKPSWDYCETCEALAELKAKVDRIKLENMQLAHDLGECMAERDELRERLSRAIDHAYAAISLTDLDGCWKDEGMA